MKHKSIIDADAEAMRLAKANPDTKFALLEAIEYYLCELPKPKAYKTETPDNCETLAEAAGMIPKMRGLHPENIVWDAPPVFIVEDPGPSGFIVKDIIIKPEFPDGPGYTCLRKDDCLILGATRESYWVCETPTGPKIRITPGPDLKKGGRLTAIGPEKRGQDA